VTASNLPKGTIKSVIAFYPGVDFRPAASKPTTTATATPPGPGTPFRPKLRNLFRASYIPPGTDLSDTRLSPICADPTTFPPTTIIIGDADGNYDACKRFYENLHSAGNNAVFMNAPGGRHAWERHITPGDTKFEALRTEAFALTIKRLKEAHESA